MFWLNRDTFIKRTSSKEKSNKVTNSKTTDRCPYYYRSIYFSPSYSQCCYVSWLSLTRIQNVLRGNQCQVSFKIDDTYTRTDLYDDTKRANTINELKRLGCKLCFVRDILNWFQAACQRMPSFVMPGTVFVCMTDVWNKPVYEPFWNM